MNELQIKARLFEISEELSKLNQEREELAKILEEVKELPQKLADNISRTLMLLGEEITLKQKLKETSHE